MHKPSKSGVLTFACGALAAFAASAFVRSKGSHSLAVRGVAGGLRLKDKAVRKMEDIREEAKDVYEEARRREAEDIID